MGRKDFKIDYININSGLSINGVNKIITDKNGIKWFGLKNGINRFDGVNFKYYYPSERYKELFNENIHALCLDDDENIWVGTLAGGLSKYDVRKDTFTNYNHLLTSKVNEFIYVSAICKDHQGNIWIASSKGVFIIDIRQSKVIQTFQELKNIDRLTTDKAGNIWLGGGENTVYEYIPATQQLKSFYQKKLGWITTLLYDESKDKLLIGTLNGLFEFTPQNSSFHKLTKAYDNLTNISSVNIDNAGRVWIGSWKKGVYVSNPERTNFKKFPLLPLYLRNKNYEVITDIHIDQNQQIWVATNFAGIIKLTPQTNFRTLANTPQENIGLPDNNILDVHKDQYGNLWCATRGNGIGYSTDGKSFVTLPSSQGLLTSCISEIDNKILVGYDEGVLVYNTHEPFGEPVKFRGEKLKKVKVLYYDTKGRLWIGTQQDGLISATFKRVDGKLRLDKILFYNDTTNQPSHTSFWTRRVSSIDEDWEGNIWIGTYDGLYKYDYQNGQFINYDKKTDHILPNLTIHTLCARKNGTLWIGFSGGLMEFAYDSSNLSLIKRYTKADGFDSNFIIAITKDNGNNLWIGHNKGISYLPNGSTIVHNWGSEEGVNISSINPNAVYIEDTQMYFGGENGILSFNPQHINISASKPKINFTGLNIDNQEIAVGDTINGQVVLTQTPSYTSHIHLTHKDKVVEFSFVANDHLGNQNIQYIYRLKGLSNHWVNNENYNKVSFNSLPAGDYMLEIKATRDKINFGETAIIRLSVIPPPWATIWAYLVYLLGFLLILYIVFRNIIKQAQLKANIRMVEIDKEKKQQLSEAKLQFFTNISHELRTPLTLILSPVSEMLNRKNLETDIKHKLTYVEKNANRLLKLINQLLDFRKAEAGHLNIWVSTNNLISFAQKSFLSFQGQAELANINYTFDTDETNIPLTFDKDKIETVLTNLLSNAFKHTPKNGKISLTIFTKEEHCYISVKDNGKGIPEKYHKDIFNRYFQVNPTENANMAGSGIGLALSKKIVELHQGTIEIQSDKGAEFIVKLPLGDKHFKKSQFESQLLEEAEAKNYTASETAETDSTTQSQLSLLIIDDNNDIRTYLKELFESKYNISTAENGKQGLEKAKLSPPDLIISDVMMPEMDGIELCNHLKSDITTSHIPVILLTAKASTEHELQGLQIGADDYIKKPFDSRIILSRVETLLHNRKHVQNYFANKVRFEPNIQPQNEVVTEIEEAFIEKAVKLIEENMDNEKLSVEFLSEELFMSQSTLYRKIKSLTGLSSVGFIRSVRLKKAAELILNEDLMFSTVASMVGFNDYKHFHRIFSKEYGMSPTEYKTFKRGEV